MIRTSKPPIRPLGDVFGDLTIASAMIDRFIQGLFLVPLLVRLDTVIKPQEEAPTAEGAVGLVGKWADLVATGGQFCWPPAGLFVAAYG